MVKIMNKKITEQSPASESDYDYINKLHNDLAYLSEGEWNAGDYSAVREELEELEKRRWQDDMSGCW